MSDVVMLVLLGADAVMSVVLTGKVVTMEGGLSF